ncbi:cobalt-precorrin-6A reductase [Rhodobacteraceae bacterium NNCM2]|nr:cobalt-precorrin-6A reductase [Coraliihabitans acroporae]
MTILLLGGTGEARALAALLREQGREVIASLAGVTRKPEDYGVPTRIGGFGGAEGLSAWIDQNRITCLIDATHPFARRMPFNAAAAAERSGIPRLRLLRPEWPPGPDWRQFDDLEAACRALSPPDRVLVTTGREDLAPFVKRPEIQFWIRTIEPLGPLPGHMHPITARPPFPLDHERELMRRHRITHLLTKNSGGSRAKLDAAEALGLTIMMIRRPAPPGGPVAHDLGSVVAWIKETVAS